MKKKNKTKSEYQQIADKSTRWYRRYLQKITEGIMSEEARKQLISIVCAVFRSKLRTDEVFYYQIREFCSEPRTYDDKKEFFELLMAHLAASGVLKKEYERRYYGTSGN